MPVDEDLGERFWNGTKDRRDKDDGSLDWDSRPETYKEYPGMERLQLPPPGPMAMPLGEAMARRQSVRTYSSEMLTKQEISDLVYCVSGINRRERGRELRNVPSAGALYPIETYICVNRAEAMAPSIYHYHVRSHSLDLVTPGPAGAKLASAALDQRMLEECSVAFIWTAVFGRQTWKYGQRAYRYASLDAGHMGQNLALACAALGLGCCHVAAFYDDEVNALLSVDGVEESAIYLSAVGRMR
ncbi:MAG: Nitroreductase family protein [Methanomassiliicoccales archaeon PtaU1.Bin124]|nr:MAG: Nitroreductase family protein [Methanomassiliicoccales archaeon PtaU1.Bin124]